MASFNALYSFLRVVVVDLLGEVVVVVEDCFVLVEGGMYCGFSRFTDGQCSALVELFAAEDLRILLKSLFIRVVLFDLKCVLKPIKIVLINCSGIS